MEMIKLLTNLQMGFVLTESDDSAHVNESCSLIKNRGNWLHKIAESVPEIADWAKEHCDSSTLVKFRESNLSPVIVTFDPKTTSALCREAACEHANREWDRSRVGSFQIYLDQSFDAITCMRAVTTALQLVSSDGLVNYVAENAERIVGKPYEKTRHSARHIAAIHATTTFAWRGVMELFFADQANSVVSHDRMGIYCPGKYDNKKSILESVEDKGFLTDWFAHQLKLDRTDVDDIKITHHFKWFYDAALNETIDIPRVISERHIDGLNRILSEAYGQF